MINQAVTKRLNPHVKMKPSEVEWIGDIPSHWEIRRLGHVSTIYKGGTPKRNVDKYFQGNIPWARPVDITALQGALYIHDTEIHITQEALNNSAAKLLPSGTVLLTSRATIGETAITTVPMATNQGFANFVCHEELNNVYLSYYLQSIKNILISLGSGSTYLEVTKGTLVSVEVPHPPFHEQTQIANFLDRKTEQIDKLIRIKERKTELLQEQRTALINQAVTKGLDPHVEMKPSGEEWIGEMPKHWEYVPIKYTLQNAKDSIRAGPFGSSLKSHEFQDTGIRVYNQQRVYNEDFSKDGIFISEEKFIELKSFIVQPKDVLISSRGTIGKMTIVPEDGEIGVLHPCLIRIRLNEKKIIPRFLWWYVNHSSFFIESVKIASNSTTIEVIYTETLSSVKIPLPKLNEQLDILHFLNEKIPLIDSAITIEHRKVELLKEYRKSLISEAVTGKIDVRTED